MVCKNQSNTGYRETRLDLRLVSVGTFRMWNALLAMNVWFAITIIDIWRFWRGIINQRMKISPGFDFPASYVRSIVIQLRYIWADALLPEITEFAFIHTPIRGIRIILCNASDNQIAAMNSLSYHQVHVLGLYRPNKHLWKCQS